MAREVANSLMLGLAMRLAAENTEPRTQAFLASAHDAEGLQAAALMTPPWPVIVCAPCEEPEAALAAIAEALAAGKHPVSGCCGLKAHAAVFACIWQKATGRHARRKELQRIHELRTVIPPAVVSGRSRLAGPDDLPFLHDWTHQFAVEAMHVAEDPPGTRSATERMVTAGRLLLWEDGSRPVSMAAAARPLRQSISISRVYTPPGHRRRGYATALVADLSRRQLEAGWKLCALFTDLANPTSNSIYQKIGYVPVADWDVYEFEKP
jgi:uncharacterized protein